jgi:rod shape-determining protein MreD
MRTYGLIVISLFFALILQLLIADPQWQWMSPYWLLLCLIYWSTRFPALVNVGVAWLFGLMLDILLGNLLGVHAFCFVVTVYVALKWQRSFLLSPMLQQILMVFLYACFYSGLLFGLQVITSDQFLSVGSWLAIITTPLLWPIFRSLLDVMMRRVARETMFDRRGICG